jgi:tetratricopeptide (TPR) repeat protein
MNFNVHRRNHSFAVQAGSRERREVRSLKKVQQSAPLEALLAEAKDIYHSQGDLREAVRLFQQFLGLSPKHNEALYLCAVSELKLGQAEHALAHLTPISHESPNKPNAMLLSAMALNKLGTSSPSQAGRCRVWNSSTSASTATRASRRPSASEASFT